MTPTELAAYGRAVVGSEQWQRPLARLLGVDARRLRRWANGDLEIEDWVEGRLRQIAEQRASELAALEI